MRVIRHALVQKGINDDCGGGFWSAISDKVIGIEGDEGGGKVTGFGDDGGVA